MIFMLSLSFIMSNLFIFMNHPLSMGLILLSQTILISLISGFLCSNFWFSYILFLIMVGGMLVLFIYMTSVASNEKFKYSNKTLIFMLIMIITSMIMLLMDNMFLNFFNYNMEMLNNTYHFNFMLSKFLNYPSNIILFMMIIYLFITLIAVVKITNINFGPLRQNF